MDLEFNKVYNMDCIEGMKNIPNNSIDLVITDPPFAIKSSVFIAFIRLFVNNLLNYKIIWQIIKSIFLYHKIPIA